MRVLLDDRVTRGGVGRYAGALTGGLRALPDPPELFTTGAGGSRLHPPFTPWGRRMVGRVARVEDADIVHGLHFECPQGANAPTVVTVPDLIPLDVAGSMPGRIRRRAFAGIVRDTLRRADRIICPSHATATRLERAGAATHKIVTVPLGLDPRWRPASELERDRARARFSEGGAYVACIGSDRTHKNLGVLARTAPLLARRNVKMLCAGANAGDIPFVGRLSDDDLRLFYAGAEAFVLPSLVEGFGLPVAESLACGTPVVCGREVGALDYLRAGVVEVDVRDPSSIEDGIALLLDDPVARAVKAETGGRAARALTIEAMAGATFDVYTDLLGAR